MNPGLWPLVAWGILWTLVGTGILALARWLTNSIPNAAGRHFTWTAAFVAIALLPILKVIGARGTDGKTPQAPVAQNSPGQIHSPAGLVSTAKTSSEPCEGSAPPTLVSRIVGWSLLGIGFSGALGTLSCGFIGWRQLGAWRRQSLPYKSTALSSPGRAIPGSQGDDFELRIASGNLPWVPITWGTASPVIMLPKVATGWTRSRLSAVICHEIGHVRRLDNFTQMFALVICAIHWFNPVFWIAARRMEVEAEMAADDFVILKGFRPSNYALELLTLAAELQPKTGMASFVQTSMVKATSLEQRVHSIINPTSCREPLNFSLWSKVIAIFGVALVTIGFLIPRLTPVITFRPEEAVPTCLHTATLPS